MTRLTKMVVIHGYEFRPALDNCIRKYETMGMHTGVVHITPTKVEKYMWGHKTIQPWGVKLSLQCQQCGVLNPWSIAYIRATQDQPVHYSMECKNPNCGKTGSREGNRERHSFKICRPPNSDSLGSGESGWLRVTLK